MSRLRHIEGAIYAMMTPSAKKGEVAQSWFVADADGKVLVGEG